MYKKSFILVVAIVVFIIAATFLYIQNYLFALAIDSFSKERVFFELILLHKKALEFAKSNLNEGEFYKFNSKIKIKKVDNKSFFVIIQTNFEDISFRRVYFLFSTNKTS